MLIAARICRGAELNCNHHAAILGGRRGPGAVTKKRFTVALISIARTCHRRGNVLRRQLIIILAPAPRNNIMRNRRRLQQQLA